MASQQWGVHRGGYACFLTALVALTLPVSGRTQTLMDLNDIEDALRRTPPALHESEARLAVLEELDVWALAEDTRYWDRNPAYANRDYLAFYLRRMQAALANAQAEPVADGTRFWHLYSSGFLVKTPHCVYGIDVVEGPFKDIRRSPEDVADYIFKWTPAMRRSYAELVDVHFVTHWHYDHASFALARELSRQGKTVVVPGQLADAWAAVGLTEGITVLQPLRDHAVGSLTVQVFPGAQYMERDDTGVWVSGKHNAENSIYWISDGGVGILHNGDNRGVDWVPWLRDLKQQGKGIDVWFWILGWPRDVHRTVTDLHSPLIVSGHEHEVGHKPKHGVSLHRNRYRGLLPLVRKGKALSLAWGESFAVPPQ